MEAPAATTGQAAVAYPLPAVREPTRMVAVVAMVSSPLAAVPVGMQTFGGTVALAVPATLEKVAQHEVAAQVEVASQRIYEATTGMLKVLFLFKK